MVGGPGRALFCAKPLRRVSLKFVLNDGRTFEAYGQRCPPSGVAANGGPRAALWPTASTALPWFEDDRDLLLRVMISTA